MGVVYEAEQISLHRRVALKVLPFAAALDPRQLQRFRIEAQAAAQLHHTSIVPVFAVGAERGVHYYAMQFIEGQSLASLIEELRQAPQLPEAADTTTVRAALSTERSQQPRAYFASVARLGKQAAEALEHAHQMGVVHRDIKPANLLLDARGQLWVTDFGLAQFQRDTGLTATNEVLELTGNPVLQTDKGTFENRVIILDRANNKLMAPGKYRIHGPAMDVTSTFPGLKK